MNQSRLQDQLARQLGFIERSCKSFDGGFNDEAVRIATTIRVLIHQTNSSDSLLTLLGVRESLKLISSIEQPDLQGLCLFDGVSILSMDGAQPNLDTSHARPVNVPTWWEEVAIISGPQMVHTRKSIVLAAANKDGGAHVDPSLTPEYEELQQGLYSLANSDADAEEILDHQFLALRVCAHELLNSPELLALAR